MTSNSNAMVDMTKPNSPTHSASENFVKNNKKKKSIIPKIFSSKKNHSRGSHDDDEDEDEDEDGPNSDKFCLDLDKKISGRKKNFMEVHPMIKKSFSERHSSPGIEGLNLSNFEQSMSSPATEIKEFRIFVATWNVGGKAPHTGLNLEDFLQVEGSADVYICGFQEIVPLSAGNVLVSEDNEPAAKWLVLINQALNHRRQDYTFFSDSSHGSRASDSSSRSNHLFHKHSMKVLSKSFRADNRLLKLCNCPVETPTRERRRFRISDPTSKLSSGNLDPCQESRGEDLLYNMPDIPSSPLSPSKMTYSLVASKQMVGIFLSVWARKELVPQIGHLRISSVGRGIMGCLGNKGCISISMTLHRTSFCFICSHLASGEKEGDELRRNADVIEILKSTQFPKICKNSYHNHVPDRIIGHDRVIWLGDLNYRVALSYEETRLLLEDNDWDALLEKDQLNLEREAGRVFPGFKEGKIMFAPTYKYTQNSDSYAGETVKSKKKRRTPAWCDRILWQGSGIEQLSYIRGESRFSDHRPVCAVFAIEAEVRNKSSSRFRKGYSCAAAADRFELDDCIPQRHSFYEYSTN